MSGTFSHYLRPSAGSWLDRWLNRHARHPETFLCGVRVVEGRLPGESAWWRHHRSAVDPLIAAGVVTLNHGPRVVLRLRPDPASLRAGGPHPGSVTMDAVEQGSNAHVQLSFDPGELARFDPGGQ